MMTRDEAAPDAEATVDLARYNPISALPLVKSSDATAAPIHTSVQAISASGRYLKIIARSSAITPNERIKLTVSNRNTGQGSSGAMKFPTAPSAALTTSDTSNRKPRPRTRPNDKKRSRIARNQILSDLHGTFQILLSASWSSTNAP